MHFGKQLQESIYPPWRDKYLRYDELKELLHPDQPPERWTEADEEKFVKALDEQLEDIYSFQSKLSQEIEQRVRDADKRVRQYLRAKSGESAKAPADGAKEAPSAEERGLVLMLDSIMDSIKHLERYSQINFTGFFKIAKRHDKLHLRYSVKPLLKVRLSACPFNSDDYSPYLYRMSALYAALSEKTNVSMSKSGAAATAALEINANGEKKHTRKFWVRPDDVMEVKTFILRRLPVLVFSGEAANTDPNSYVPDPVVSSLYLDNRQFSLYNDKMTKAPQSKSLRLRWYDKLDPKSNILLELKSSEMAGEADITYTERHISLRDKNVCAFLAGDRSAAEAIVKRAPEGKDMTELENLVTEIQQLVETMQLQPVLRAVYSRMAFQIPGDNTVRASIDTNLCFVREDVFDDERPSRHLDEWHRTDVDQMDFPYDRLRKGEISRFPFALLEIKTLLGEGKPEPRWVQELVASKLVREATGFSKYAHGVATLYDRYVNLLPFWINNMEGEMGEPFTTEAKPNLPPKLLIKSPPGHRDGTIGGLQSMSSLPPVAVASSSSKRGTEEGGEDEYDSDSAIEDIGTSLRMDTNMKFGISSIPKILNRRGLNRAMYGTLPRQKHAENAKAPKVESKVWMANERTLAKWLNTTALLAALSLSFINSARTKSAITIAFAYLLCSLVLGCWSLFMFKRRVRWIMESSSRPMCDIVGPICLTVVLLVFMALNFVGKVGSGMRGCALT